MIGWRSELNNINTFTSAEIENSFKTYVAKMDAKIGAVLLPFRLLVTAVPMGPGMFDIASFLGKEEVLRRMDFGLESVQKIIHEAHH